jgi:AbrB family looped-hinge helix DNA binding protein
MDMARISSKGQVTIPISIRRKLKLREGDKVVFMEQAGGIVLLNSNLLAWRELQEDFSGVAAEVGWESEEDAVNFCRELRQARWEAENGHHD